MAEEATGQAEAALAAARERGIHLLSIPTPFAVGRVNCYLVEGDPLTLIDAGPRSEQAMEALEEAIAATGNRLEEIGLVVASHEHIDHIGNIRTVAERSGAAVAALDRAVPRLGDFDSHAIAENEMAVELMIRNGVSEEIATRLRSIADTYRDLGDDVPVDTPLSEGSMVRFGSIDLEVHHRPGHSPSDTIFVDPLEGLCFGGDHLLSHISSNPLIARPLDGSPGRTRSLIDYADSLRATRAMDISTMLSGHGEPITDHRALIDSYLKAQERRRRKVLGIIREQPLTAHGIASAIWGDVAVTQAYLTMSEVVGHTDVLQDEGLVTEVERDGLTVFEAAG